MPRSALIGSSGFVGGLLGRQRCFDRAYNSKNIDEIAGEAFDLVVCAGAPATMWAANSQPEIDMQNINRLLAALRSATIGRLVVISTVAVLDRLNSGYTETTAQFELRKPYGRNRRELEIQAMSAFDCHIVRLPALFGRGLKKNFIFDLMNPVPSFIAAAKYAELQDRFDPNTRKLLGQAFSYDEALNMWRFDRQSYRKDTPAGAHLVSAFRAAGFLSTSFTNSDSSYQFYNVERLNEDITICIENRIPVLHICSQPMRAAEIHLELTGQPFDNPAAPRVEEDVRSDFAQTFGQSGPYLYNRDTVLRELKEFIAERERS